MGGDNSGCAKETLALLPQIIIGGLCVPPLSTPRPP